MCLYKEIKQIVLSNNEKYEEIVKESHDLTRDAKLLLEKFEQEKDPNVFEKLLIAQEQEERSRHKLWQFQHDYATEVQSFVLNNFLKLTSGDVRILDLVPSVVYKKISAKAQITIQTIYRMK